MSTTPEMRQGFDPLTNIVVASGLPRSGTSMLMQMLVAGGVPAVTDAARVPDEDNPAGYLEDDRVKMLLRDNSWLTEATGKTLKVVAPLLDGLDDTLSYRIIFILRDLDEVVRSQQAMLERSGNSGALMPAEQLAKKFELMLTRIRMQLLKRFPGDVLFLDYRTCTESPAQAASQINHFLGGQLDTGAMAAAINPTLYRNRNTAA